MDSKNWKDIVKGEKLGWLEMIQGVLSTIPIHLKRAKVYMSYGERAALRRRWEASNRSRGLSAIRFHMGSGKVPQRAHPKMGYGHVPGLIPASGKWKSEARKADPELIKKKR